MVDEMQRGLIPVPDPSALTDKAIERASAIFDDKITAHREFLVEKIEGSVSIIKTRLDGNDTALVAALQAQKEAAAKQTENFTAILDESKKGTAKQIDSLSDKIEDLKGRLSEAGGRSSGASATLTFLISAVAAIAAVVSVVIVMSRPGPPTQVQVQPSLVTPIVPQQQHGPSLLYRSVRE